MTAGNLVGGCPGVLVPAAASGAAAGDGFRQPSSASAHPDTSWYRSPVLTSVKLGGTAITSFSAIAQSSCDFRAS
jgi:hypothetical protein